MQMETQQELDYQRIEKAIDYIITHFKEQPHLESIAAVVGLSPFHFQRLFTQWAGTSPKQFLHYISLDHARKLLKDSHSLSDTAYLTGLSSTSRLHDLFVHIEAMTPAEYQRGGELLAIEYSFSATPFGTVIVASTPRGICHMAFIGDEATAFLDLKLRFPNAHYTQNFNNLHQQALSFFDTKKDDSNKLPLHLKGTPFQLKVWEALLKIPAGQLTTYGSISSSILQPKASRAVGTAIGQNPVAYIIPCHRVIQASGLMGGYMWGTTRKTAIIGWESAHNDLNE
jgi:AraC family transcriptional regulator of adaptative response/methylated-DNA-[protein]-cysteine methyltransferase